MNKTPITQIDCWARLNNRAIRYHKGYFYMIDDEYHVSQ